MPLSVYSLLQPLFSRVVAPGMASIVEAIHGTLILPGGEITCNIEDPPPFSVRCAISVSTSHPIITEEVDGETTKRRRMSDDPDTVTLPHPLCFAGHTSR